MQKYSVVLTGLTPLIMHKDDLGFSEEIMAWRKDPANKEHSTAGDDRTPPWTWIGYLYHNNENIVMDSDNLMTMTREGGAKVLTGKGKETYKKLVASGIMMDLPYAKFFVDGKEISIEKIEPLIGNLEFLNHLKTAQSLGFNLLVKRAKIGQAKHVRVRPIFENWSVEYTMTVLDEKISGITKDRLQLILEQSGALVGLCDWRPGSPKSPGSFGKFSVSVKAIKG
jgi:hypothetical protein